MNTGADERAMLTSEAGGDQKDRYRRRRPSELVDPLWMPPHPASHHGRVSATKHGRRGRERREAQRTVETRACPGAPDEC